MNLLECAKLNKKTAKKRLDKILEIQKSNLKSGYVKEDVAFVRLVYNRCVKALGVSKDEGYSLEFERFWNIHPHKANKPNAFHIWQETVTDPDWVIQSAKLYTKKMKGQEVHGVKHADIWLKDKRWEDFDKNQVKHTVGCQVCGGKIGFEGKLNGSWAKLCCKMVGPGEYSDCYKTLIGD